MSLLPVRWVADCGLRVAHRAGLLSHLNREARPIVLMYHGILWRKDSAVGVPAVDREAFLCQMQYLKRYFHILSPNDLIEGMKPASHNGKPPVILTFDDGLGTNATIAAPILHDLRIPAIFFVSVRHLQPHRYLWFMHARALFSLWPARQLELLGRRWRLGSAIARKYAYQAFLRETTRLSSDAVYRALAPYVVEDFVAPDIIERELRGMTEAEVAAIARDNLIVIGSHTYNHPYLTNCTTSQLEEEINGSKAALEQICRRKVTTFAYPAGNYNSTVIAKIQQAGFDLAFAVKPLDGTRDARMTIPRVGIYQADFGIFAGKCYGLFSPR